MQTLSTPDITLMQKLVAALGGVIVALIVLVNAFEFYDVTAEQSGAVMGLWAAVGSVLVLADAIIRNGRSRILANAPVLPVATGPSMASAVEETAPGYAGERIVYREDTDHGHEKERDLEA